MNPTELQRERPFFKPVSLSPRLALLAVNLATGPIGQGPVIDPMTGTGGFIMEAAATNRRHWVLTLIGALHLFLSHLPVQVEQQNITDSSAQIVRGDATNIEASIDKSWVGKVQGFVFDPPYGRNSQGSLNHDELLTKTLTSAHQVASSDANLVLIVPIDSMPAQINHPLADDSQVELLHGDWDSLQQLMNWMANQQPLG